MNEWYVFGLVIKIGTVSVSANFLLAGLSIS